MSPAPLVTRDFVLLTLAHLLQALGFTSMVLLPVYLDHLGASATTIGAVMASASVSGLLARPAVARALDRWGRKPTLVAGTAVLVAGMALFGAVVEVGPLAVVARMLVGIGTGTLFTGYFALASDIVPAEHRTRGLALFGVSGLVPLVINPIAREAGFEPSELRWLFVALGALVALSLVPLLPVREPPRPAPAQRPTRREVLATLRQPRLRPVWAAVIAFSTLASCFMAFSTVAAEHRGIASPAALWFAYAGGAVAVRLVFGPLADRVGPGRLVPPAFASFAVGCLGIALAESDLAFLAAGFFAGLGHGVGFPVLTSQAVTRTPEVLRGSGLATLTGFWELSALLATPAFGLLADLGSDRAQFSVLAAVAVLGAACWGPLERRAAATPADAL